MKTFLYLLCFYSIVFIQSVSAQHKFTIDLNDIADDQFKVTLIPDGLAVDNDIFQFASTAPGTYQIMDIGRFVRKFEAYDKDGNHISTEQISANQWKISEPEKVNTIKYAIAETWDTPVESHVVYNMAGTSIESDHAFVLPHAVLGYFKGMQSHEIWIKLLYEQDWQEGSALTKNDEGYFTAPTFDFAVDSPILVGRLSHASTEIEETKIDVYTYSKTDMIKSNDILKDLEDILYAASDFTDGLPVDRYVFLFHFEDLDFGAWEHSYSSGYVLKESPLDAQKINGIRSIVAHEFFHVVTPLNIHSELVGQFNFETPRFSQHLWLYEGVTEWAAWMMQLQDSLISLDTYLNSLSGKLKQNDGYDPTISLTELGVNAMELPAQYQNIYLKGAMTASILDLILLEQSKGKKGLRILINELAKEYGPNRPFDEDGFFDELTASTYPEVGDFIEKYIKGTESLPVKEHFESIGIEYTEFAGYDSTGTTLEFGFTLKDNQIAIPNVENSELGIQSGDILYKIDGTEISLMNARQEIGKLHQKKPGENVTFVFKRDNEEVEVDYILPAKKIAHQFMVIEKPSKKQLKLREKWMTN